MSPFQGAQRTPHSWVTAKALVYWLTDGEGNKQNEIRCENETDCEKKKNGFTQARVVFSQPVQRGVECTDEEVVPQLHQG